ncbi:MAG: hypothetical protein AVDCRST_MAG10-2087, partial [uncultured Acidimicrobiales bacterium]
EPAADAVADAAQSGLLVDNRHGGRPAPVGRPV